MAKRTLKFRYHDGRSMSDQLLREMWRVRTEMLRLGVTEEEDWAYFQAFVQREDTAALVFYDAEGAVQGFFTISYLPVEHGGRKRLLLFSKYFYFRKAYRGHYKQLVAPWLLLPISFRRFGLRSLHFVTSAYPQSFVSLSRSAGKVYSLRSDDITEWKVEALMAFARDFYGDDFDAEARLVRNQNVVDTEALPRSSDARALAEEYERLNPEWRTGCSLPILFSVDASLIRHNVARMGRRFLPRSHAQLA